MSKSKIEDNPVVSDPSNFEVIANPHSVAVLNDAVKNDTILAQEILPYFTRTESFDPANYSNNTPTKSSLSSSTSYLSILKRTKTLEHAVLEAKLAVD